MTYTPVYKPDPKVEEINKNLYALFLQQFNKYFREPRKRVQWVSLPSLTSAQIFIYNDPPKVYEIEEYADYILLESKDSREVAAHNLGLMASSLVNGLVGNAERKYGDDIHIIHPMRDKNLVFNYAEQENVMYPEDVGRAWVSYRVKFVAAPVPKFTLRGCL